MVQNSSIVGPLLLDCSVIPWMEVQEVGHIFDSGLVESAEFQVNNQIMSLNATYWNTIAVAPSSEGPVARR
jgi:hypothetical protein